jgi:hypothetical protein
VDREALFDRVKGNKAEPNNETRFFQNELVAGAEYCKIANFEADPDLNSSQKHLLKEKFWSAKWKFRV